jgi:hypothetical protein
MARKPQEEEVGFATVEDMYTHLNEALGGDSMVMNDEINIAMPHIHSHDCQSVKKDAFDMLATAMSEMEEMMMSYLSIGSLERGVKIIRQVAVAHADVFIAAGFIPKVPIDEYHENSADRLELTYRKAYKEYNEDVAETSRKVGVNLEKLATHKANIEAQIKEYECKTEKKK